MKTPRINYHSYESMNRNKETCITLKEEMEIVKKQI